MVGNENKLKLRMGRRLHRIVIRHVVHLSFKCMNHGHEFGIFNEQFFDNHICTHKLFVLEKQNNNYH